MKTFGSLWLRPLMGSMMLEWLIVMMVMAMLSPGMVTFFRWQYRQLTTVAASQRRMIEQLDTQRQIQRDMARIHTVMTDCCFENDTHRMCYDIRSGRFRRRKKRRNLTQFYTHYIGQLSHWQGIQCTASHQRVQIKLIREDQSFIWDYGYGTATGHE